jgi:hypothetical protein
VQGALSRLPDSKDVALADPSRQAWLEKIPFSLGSAYSIHQPEQRKSLIFNAFSGRLIEQKANGFQRIITWDESRFVLGYCNDSVWAASPDELAQYIKA